MAKTKQIKLNMKFINQLKARLREEPKAYDQSRFSPRKEWDGENWTVPSTNLCGTPVCIAGHGYLMLGHTVEQLVRVADDGDDDNITDAVTKATGFPKEFTDNLFSSASEWPAEFSFNDNTLSKKKQVEKACEYIDALVVAVGLLNKHPFLPSVFERMLREDQW